MTSFLLTISFILHLILLIAIFHLKQEVEKSNNNKAPEIKKLFETYLNEIKKENERLKLDLKTYRVDRQLDKTNHKSIHNKTINYAEIVKENNLTKNEQINDSLLNSIIPSEKDEIETSIQAKILQLHDEGLTIEQIARKLNCGKTEAELIIHLFQQKNS